MFFFSQVIRFFKNVFLARLKLRGSEGEAIQMNLINCYRLDRLEIIFIFSTAFRIFFHANFYQDQVYLRACLKQLGYFVNTSYRV